MTVSSTTKRNSYTGNGSTTTFAYSFKIFDDDDITVILRTTATGTETVQTKTTHYSVTGVGNSSGGNVVFGSAPTSAQTVVLLRQTAQTQATDYTPNDPFPAASHEDALDKLTLMTQDQQDELDRSIKLSRTNTMTSTEFTVGATDRANKILAFDSSGELSVTQELGTNRGDWAASTSYNQRDIVKDTSTGNIFFVNEAHTSSGSQPLTTNTNSSKYDLLIESLFSGVTAGTVSASKGVLVDGNKDITGFRNITLSGELTLGSGAVINEAELEAIDGVTAGTVAASKAVVVDSNKDAASFRNITLTGELDAGSLDVSGDADIDGTLEADAITVNGTALNTVIAGVTVTDATNSAHVLVTDNESTNEENLITFVEDATSSTGNVGLEMDGNLTYNPSTGTITATVFKGNIDAVDGDFDGTLEADAMTLNGTAITATATLDTGISNNNVPKFTSGVADNDFLRVDGTAIEGRSASEVLSDIGGQAALTFGISNTNIPIFTSGVADNDFLRIDGTSVEGRSASEVLSDIGAAPAAGDSNIVTTGALNSGSITSGFGAIDVGSSNITTTGVGTFGSLDISGDIDVDGTTNLDAVDIDGNVDIVNTATLTCGAITSSISDHTNLTLTSTSADANAGPKIALVRDSSSPADGDSTGAILFKADDSAGNSVVFSEIQSVLRDVTNTAEDGELQLNVRRADSLVSGIKIGQTEAVVNEDSQNVDFRVESNGNANMLFVDGGNDKVGIGTNSPDTCPLHIVSGDTHQIKLESSSGDITRFQGDSFVVTRNGDYFFDNRNASTNNFQYRCGSSAAHIFNIGTTEKMRIDSSGNLLVGRTSAGTSGEGVSLRPTSSSLFARDSGIVMAISRNSDDGQLIGFQRDGTSVGDISTVSSDLAIMSTTSGHKGLRFGNGAITPTTNTGGTDDDATDLGGASIRFDDIFATNGTIQTSDENEKQNIATLTSAEITAAKAISKLFKTFKWKSKVTAKGDAARTHTGVIAQEVQAAMSDAGLDATKYAFWCSDTWWETSTEVAAVKAVEAADAVYDDDGKQVSAAVEAVEAKDAYTRVDTYDTEEEAPEGATKRTRLGVRYPELLAFIGAATEQRLADIETRLAALEAG